MGDPELLELDEGEAGTSGVDACGSFIARTGLTLARRGERRSGIAVYVAGACSCGSLSAATMLSMTSSSQGQSVTSLIWSGEVRVVYGNSVSLKTTSGVSMIFLVLRLSRR